MSISLRKALEDLVRDLPTLPSPTDPTALGSGGGTLVTVGNGLPVFMTTSQSHGGPITLAVLEEAYQSASLEGWEPDLIICSGANYDYIQGKIASASPILSGPFGLQGMGFQNAVICPVAYIADDSIYILNTTHPLASALNYYLTVVPPSKAKISGGRITRPVSPRLASSGTSPAPSTLKELYPSMVGDVFFRENPFVSYLSNKAALDYQAPATSVRLEGLDSPPDTISWKST